MSIASEILGRRMQLIAPETHAVTHQPDLAVAADDGVTLLADRWVATADLGHPQPTVLVRSPYGRTGFIGLMFGRMLAERGLQVVIQSVRGTFGSGGDFTPFDERADGLATLRWLRRQPWHRDRVGTFGPSYLGLVQWAIAADAGEDLAAMAIQVSASQFFDQTYAGGGMSLETAASWMAVMTAQESRLAPLAIDRAVRGLAAHMSELPLGDLDERATGTIVPWYREAFSHPKRDDPYWAQRDFSGRRAEITAPVSFVGGWYDIFLPWMLADHAALAAAGAVTRLTVGPWAHTSPGLVAAGHRDGIAWLRAHLLDDRRLLSDSSVRVYVTGEPAGGGWRELVAWPPPGTGERPLWLGEGARLQAVAPATGRGGVDRYRYDPAAPTPAVGGPILLSRDPVVDNCELEARDDVLVYTGEMLTETVEAVGEVRVELYVSADSEFFDLFARVCDVDGDGVSRNVCDALARVTPESYEPTADGIRRVGFALWPLGHRFAAGHRIRLQVSSGAHPRYARNPGTGDDLGAGTRLRPVSIQIHRGEPWPSAVVLPSGP